jgi:hypothetical protein
MIWSCSSQCSPSQRVGTCLLYSALSQRSKRCPPPPPPPPAYFYIYSCSELNPCTHLKSKLQVEREFRRLWDAEWTWKCANRAARSRRTPLHDACARVGWDDGAHVNGWFPILPAGGAERLALTLVEITREVMQRRMGFRQCLEKETDLRSIYKHHRSD